MELVILTGLQAAGKSTFYRQRFAGTHELVSKDLLQRHRGSRQAQLIEAALSAGRSVVVDNTNPSLEERAELIRLGRAHGAEITVYFFEPHVGQSLKRNEQRTGKARVPHIGIFAIAKRLVPPTYAEGFDKLYRVRIAEGEENTAGENFEVSEVARD
ncbi:MAG TPA: ATP-binding protein [Ktedonobacteraceae bacterium]|nr:ATP-binding protein [Ktedonobacteraceae bacterium]